MVTLHVYFFGFVNWQSFVSRSTIINDPVGIIKIEMLQLCQDAQHQEKTPLERGANGEGGIRTHGAREDTLVFKTRAINHSTTSPEVQPKSVYVVILAMCAS